MLKSIHLFFSLFRVNQYIKNIFIFLPFFFAQRFTELHTFSRLFLAFIIFSFLASAVYIINDIQDVAEDKIHPVKRNRPIASGKINVTTAWAISIFLIVLTLLSFLFLFSLELFYLSAGYLLLNLLYCFKLKHFAIIDISIIAMGFVLRLLVGGMVADIRLSHWIVLMTFLLSLFIALAKRRDDLKFYIKHGTRFRKSINGYNLPMLDNSMTIMSTVLIMSYIMYCVSPEVIKKTGSDNLYITTIFVILGVLRYLQISFLENKSGNPTQIVLTDTFMKLILSGWLITFGALLYL